MFRVCRFNSIHKFPHKNPLVRKKLAKEYSQKVSEAFNAMNNQPYSVAIDPQKAYDTAKVILDTANRYRTHVYFDLQLKRDGLVREMK